MYNSPIELISNEVISEMKNEVDEQIYTAVQNVGITVKKEELIKALNYDREQYEAGYDEGYDDGYNADKWIYCKDKLPEESINEYTQDYNDVICFCKFGNDTAIKVYQFGNNHFYYGFQIMDSHVIAWQPLPEKPQEYIRLNK